MSRQLILLWLLTIGIYANQVHWLGNYATALQLSHKEHKSLLVLVVKHKDPLSNTIIKNHFMNHAYVDSINQKMIAVIVTYEGRSSYPVEMYYTRVFPALFFVDNTRELFFREPLYGEKIETNTLKEIFSAL